jgi:DNA-binding transcriptional MerR regulator
LEKAPDAFRTISEVAEEINVPQHVLRFWESRFVQIKPLKRGGGRRYYRPDDVDLLRGVRHLLYGEGYTIRGVQRILREEGLAFVQNVWRPGADLPTADDAEDDETEVEEVSVDAELETEEEEDEEALDTRREPTLLPPGEHVRSRLAADSEARRKLQRALDDLVVCQQLIDAAFAAATFRDDQSDAADADR